MPATATTLFDGQAADEALLINGGGVRRVGEFLAGVAAFAGGLGEAGALINLCDGREAFLTAYVAALTRGVTTLLPQSRAPDVVEAVRALVPGSRAVDDADVAAALGGAAAPVGSAVRVPVPPDHLAMLGFTSGSTGVPSRHAKRWGSVAQSTVHNAAAIRAALPAAARATRPWIVGTVPSQHMYGMELTVLLPLLAGMGLHTARPLLPADVAAVLSQTPEPRVLVSTPAHLRAIVSSGVTLPAVAVTVSATAPLDAVLAAAVEQATGGVLIEMFGSTETCILGSRRTATQARWTPYPGVRFLAAPAGTEVSAPWFGQAECLQDRITVDAHGQFALEGRSADLIDVAGKRASLAELTQRVLDVPGVVDAVVFQPDASAGLVRRVAALVVAPGLTAQAVRDALAPAIDPVFMPRPLLLVEALPRTAAGKLPLARLSALLVGGD